MTRHFWATVCLMFAGVIGMSCRPAGRPSAVTGEVKALTSAAQRDAAEAADPSTTNRIRTGAKVSTQASPKQDDGRPRFALLVGCTRYYHNPRRNLKGPANDVLLMRRMLIERYHFMPRNIVILSEKAGGRHTPTRAHIQHEMDELASKAKATGKKTQIVVLLSGHGSQQPDNDPENEIDIEHDGLDETFLPADIGRWSKAKQTVVNAIVDDELRRWTKAITHQGASLWIIVDACHSGTALRGEDGDEVARRVEPEELGIPNDALSAARQRVRGTATRGELPFDQITFEIPTDAPALAAVYAAQSYEQEQERRPYNSNDPRRYGLLTYTICHALLQARSPLTYRELVAHINRQYIHWGRRGGPTPLVEGKLQDRLVLGSTERSPAFTLGHHSDGDGWQIDSGRLRGLTAGTILAVYPPPGSVATDKPLGHVKITDLRMFTAAVEPVAYAKLPAPDTKQLVDGGRCQVIFVNYGPLRMAVTVDRLVMTPDKAVKPTAEQAMLLDQLSAEIKRSASQPGIPFRWVDRLEQAGWVVQIRNGQPLLLPADAAARVGPLPAEIPVVALNQTPTGGQLAENLTRIARAQNLIELASSSASEVARGSLQGAAMAGDVNVEVTMLRLRDKLDSVGTPLRWKQQRVQLHHGDLVTWQLTNKGYETVDVSLLFVNSHLGIQALFPRPNCVEDNRLLPGRSLRTIAVPVNAIKSTGLEHVVAVAMVVVPNSLPVDFTLLEQPSLDIARGAGVRGDSDPTLDTPLGQLLQRACYANGTTRGLDTDVVDDYELQLLTWRVMPIVGEGNEQ